MDEFKTKKIRVYRNGDNHHIGKRLVINARIFRNFEQFLLAFSDELRLSTGAVRKLVEMESGAPVRALDELKDGMFYVATSGDPYKRIQYTTHDELGMPLGVGSQRNLAPMGVAPRRTETRGRRRVNDSNGGLLLHEDDDKGETPIFGPTSKAYRIIIFENGEQADPGLKMILNHRNCKSFEQLLRHLSSVLILKTGQVRKLYDARTGRRIRNLHDIQAGHNLVAATWENFKKLPYQFQDLTSIAPVVKRDQDPPRIVTFYPNGDSYHTGLLMTIVKRRFTNFSRLLDTLNTQIELVTGKIRKIYTLHGVRVTTLDEFENGKGYVLVANEDPFIKTKYDLLSLKNTHVIHPLNGHTFDKRSSPRASQPKPKTPAPEDKPVRAVKTPAAEEKPVSRGAVKTPAAPAQAVDSRPVSRAAPRDVKSPQQQGQATPKTKPNTRGAGVVEEDHFETGDEVYGGQQKQMTSQEQALTKELKAAKKEEQVAERVASPRKPKTAERPLSGNTSVPVSPKMTKGASSSLSKEALNEKVLSNKQLNEKVLSAKQLNEKVLSKEALPEKVLSKQELVSNPRLVTSAGKKSKPNLAE